VSRIAQNNPGPEFAAFYLAQENSISLEVNFSPYVGATETILKELDKAKDTILLQACTFTSAPIAKALLNAHKRGVRVDVILDKSQRTDQYSSATFLYNSGIRDFYQ
jgi:phosphatidylserine/phosphatidylglycerophosphate/cardiolipin synthase-like enzyme